MGFKIASLFSNRWLFFGVRAIFLLLVSYIHPFGFNWFIPEITLVPSYFAFDKLFFGIFLAILVLFLATKRLYWLLFLLPLSVFTPLNSTPLAPLKIDLVTTHIPQEKKWLLSERAKIIEENFETIEHAIKQHKDIVVLPESAFPLFLDHSPKLLEQLLALSQNIAIVTGALSYKSGHNYNSTYLFWQGKYKIFDKVVLVPFGEEVPLPKPIASWVNKIFFDGASDYKHAQTPQTFTIKGVCFTNAICYEATHPLLYTTSTPYIIAISNNAWFWPSIEPFLQNLIIRYYATIHKKVVYHATNIAKTGVIR